MRQRQTHVSGEILPGLVSGLERRAGPRSSRAILPSCAALQADISTAFQKAPTQGGQYPEKD
jgi:hypothetical protein